MRGENKAYGGALLAHLGFGVYCYDQIQSRALALGAVLEVERNIRRSPTNNPLPFLYRLSWPIF
jgi:hypothetical protein